MQFNFLGGWIGLGGWIPRASQQNFGGWGANATDDSPMQSLALIQTQSGLTGDLVTPPRPAPLGLDDPARLAKWEPWVRQCVIDFEMFSSLGFTPSPNGAGMTLWHLHVEPTPSAAPAATYHPILAMVRPSEQQFVDQLQSIAEDAGDRLERQAEILTQLPGGIAFMASVAYLDPARTPWTLELIFTALRLATHVEMRFKHAFACRRPSELSPQIQPMIQTPAHGSYPSGHATESFVAALVLSTLLRRAGQSPANPQYAEDLWGTQLMHLAVRIAQNREVAGVHYPIDSAAGAVLGLTLGEYLVSRCEACSFNPGAFDGTQYPATVVPLEEVYRVDGAESVRVPTAHAPSLTDAAFTPAHNAILSFLWEQALAEWT